MKKLLLAFTYVMSSYSFAAIGDTPYTTVKGGCKGEPIITLIGTTNLVSNDREIYTLDNPPIFQIQACDGEDAAGRKKCEQWTKKFDGIHIDEVFIEDTVSVSNAINFQQPLAFEIMVCGVKTKDNGIYFKQDSGVVGTFRATRVGKSAWFDVAKKVF